MKKILSIFAATIFLTSGTCFAKISETTWTPDTCDCQVVYETDTDKPNDPPVLKRIIKEEKSFEGDDGATMFSKILDENKRKNIIFGEAKKINPDLTPEEFHYRFDSERKLVVSAPGLKKTDEPLLEFKVDGDLVDVE